MSSETLEETYNSLYQASSLKGDLLRYHESSLFALVQDLSKDCPLVSSLTIRKIILEILRNDLENNLISAEVLDLPKLLTANTKIFRAYVPIYGIKLYPSQIDLGRFTIYRHDRGPLARIREDSLWRDNEAKCYVEVRDVEASVSTTPIAGIKMIHHDFVIEEAHRVAQDVEHILNFYFADLENLEEGYHHITTSPPVSSSQITAFDVQDSTQALHSTNRKSIHYWHYEITEDTIEKLYLLDLVIEIFNEKKIKGMRQKLKKSIIWYSKGINARDSSEQFVNFTIALESLLVNGRGNNPTASWAGIAQKIAESVCFLIGGSGYQERLELMKEMKLLYTKRSKIVHSGEKTTINELHRLNIICRDVIRRLLELNFDSWEEWEEWLKERLYGNLPIESNEEENTD